MSNRNAMTTLTRWVLGHKLLVGGLWIVLAIAGFAAMKPAGDALSTTFNIPGSEAFSANSRIAEIYGNGGDVAPIVPVVTLPKGTTVDSPGVTRELQAAVSKVEAALPAPGSRPTRPRVTGPSSPRTAARPSRWSRSRRAAASTPGRPRRARRRRRWPASPSPASPVRVTGLDALRAAAADGGKAGGASLAVEALVAGVGALLVLAFVFASWMAIVPLLMAIVAIPTTFLLIWPLASA